MGCFHTIHMPHARRHIAFGKRCGVKRFGSAVNIGIAGFRRCSGVAFDIIGNGDFEHLIIIGGAADTDVGNSARSELRAAGPIRVENARAVVFDTF